MGILDLESQLTFYAAYHRHPTNIAIHLLFVPTIMFTGFALGTNLPTLYELPYLPVNVTLLVALSFVAGYVLMEPVAGALAAPVVLAFAGVGTWVVREYGASANAVLLALHVASWLFQFVGHGVWEKKAPALLDNLVQALYLAPFFVFFEGLFWCGYRPELRQRIERMSAEKRRKLDAGKDSAAANGNGVKKEL